MDDFKYRLTMAMADNHISRYKLAKECGISPSTVTNWLIGATSPDKTKADVVADYLGINRDWLSDGVGDMMDYDIPSEEEIKDAGKIGHVSTLADVVGDDDLDLITMLAGLPKETVLHYLKKIKNQSLPDDLDENKKKIPLYDDVASIGGQHEMTSDMIGTTNPSDYIDAGDWFREATVAIRHYGKSMTEYPPGCILALKEVNDRRLLIPGRDYVIETDEYRVTKKIQVMDTHIRAHSTNTEKYDDGTLIYQPFDIPLEAIRRMFIVLGYVVKKSGGTLLYNR